MKYNLYKVAGKDFGNDWEIWAQDPEKDHWVCADVCCYGQEHPREDFRQDLKSSYRCGKPYQDEKYRTITFTPLTEEEAFLFFL